MITAFEDARSANALPSRSHQFFNRKFGSSHHLFEQSITTNQVWIQLQCLTILCPNVYHFAERMDTPSDYMFPRTSLSAFPAVGNSDGLIVKCHSMISTVHHHFKGHPAEYSSHQ